MRRPFAARRCYTRIDRYAASIRYDRPVLLGPLFV